MTRAIRSRIAAHVLRPEAAEPALGGSLGAPLPGELGDAGRRAHAVDHVEERELAEAAAVAAQQPPGLEHAGADAFAREHDGDVLDAARGAPPLLGEGREVRIVLQQDPPAEALVEGLCEAEVELAPERLAAHDAAVAVHGGGHPGADGEDIPRAAAAGLERAQGGRRDRVEALGVGLLRDAGRGLGEGLAAEVGDEHRGLGDAEVDPEHGPGVGPEREAAGGPALLGAGGSGDGWLLGPAAPREVLAHGDHGRACEPRVVHELADAQHAGGRPEHVEHGAGIDPADHVGPGRGDVLHGA